jgi:4-amino-4-deoxy-L-arabinose transferase-like glycosyltransferase
METKRILISPSTAEIDAEVKQARRNPLERWFWLVVPLVILVSAALQIYSVAGECQTWDEGIHIASGYAYLTRGDFRWNQEHPPLVKLVSALPLLLAHPQLPVDTDGWRKLDETQVGVSFLYHNQTSADTLLLTSRGTTILLSALFLAGLAALVRRRFGAQAALLALCLCAFDPNLTAHARYVTTDFPVAVFYFFAAFLWMEYLLERRFRTLGVAAVAFALALATKFSAVLLIPTLAALYAVRWWQTRTTFSWRRDLAAAGVFTAATALIIGLVYWPETVRCWSGTVPALAATVKRGNFSGDLLYRAGVWFHLPAHAFFTGLAKVADHNSSGHSSYLLGMRSERGWWYYFPIVFAVKSTMAALAALAILVAAGCSAAFQTLRRAGSRTPPASSTALFVWCGLLIPPVLYFGFSMTSAINIGMRHILPVYPFLYVAVAAWLAGSSRRRAALCAMAVLAALQIFEYASIAPDYLAFFNRLAGGPGGGPRYLVDSNIDWGQDLKKLKKWLSANGTDTVTILYFGNGDMETYGIRTRPFPAPLDEKGWKSLDGYAVASVTPLYGVYVPLDWLAPLRLRDPVAKVGWSLYVYDFHSRPVVDN